MVSSGSKGDSSPKEIMKPVFLLEDIHTTVVPALMQKSWLPLAFGTLGLTEEPSPDFRTSIVQTAEADPQVLAALHESAGLGSSQTYLVLASVTVVPSTTINVANATLHECAFIFMVKIPREILDS
jgi:hypothetical protein